MTVRKSQLGESMYFSGGGKVSVTDTATGQVFVVELIEVLAAWEIEEGK